MSACFKAFIIFVEKCSSGLTCKNGGYINVECKCACPVGFTGSTCESVVTDSGEWFVTSEYDKNLRNHLII